MATGAEFQVNTYTAYDQGDPSIAALADGGFVVTWQSGAQYAGVDDRVYAQIYEQPTIKSPQASPH